ncbi:MAG: hypothetical protein LBN93_11480 [Candidatus Symbiothrix sp.]|nr:hypothetical protein [Candidatus Symbiothrix sp.]
MLTGCSKDESIIYYADGADAPSGLTVGTPETFGFGVIVPGAVTSDGGSPIQAKGIVYSATNATPTLNVNDETVKVDGNVSTGTGDFSSLVLGLTANTNYYYRAYALNGAGVSYGDVKTLNTGQAPVVVADMESEFFEEGWQVEVQAVPKISFYNVLDMYQTGYHVRLTVDGTKVTVAKQVIIANLSGYGPASVEGTGTFDGKTFVLKLKFTVSAGTFSPNPATEVITLP